MDKLSEAICFVTAAFEGMKRKCVKSPAVFHSLEAGCIAQTLTDDADTVIATILHDTVEDAGVTLDEIRARFGDRVAQLVKGETENKRETQDPHATWQVRKEEAIEILSQSKDIGLKILFLSDKLSNMRSLYQCKLKFGEALWQMFHQHDPKMHLWYYKTIAQKLPELADTVAYQEYIELIEKTFSEE